MTKLQSEYYTVNDRPVKIVILPDGGSDALALDWATGGFVPERSYFRKTSEPSGDVDKLTEDEFTALVRVLREPIITKLRATPLAWQTTSDGFTAKLGEKVLAVRTAAAGYTLVVGGEAVAELADWPAAWTKAS